MDPITIALGLAQFAPMLMRFFGVGEKNVQVAEKVIGVAQAVTGKGTPEEALAAIKASTELQMQFQDRILDRQQELEKLYYADVASARSRDVEIKKTGQRNIRADSMYVLAIIVVGAIFTMIWMRPEIPEFIKGVVTLVLGRFLGYLDQMYNFEFGTTRTSRDKDQTITKLSEKG